MTTAYAMNEADLTTSTADLMPNIKQPSKIRILLIALLVVTLVLALIFIVLYAIEKNESDGQITSNTSKSVADSCLTHNCISSASGIIESLDTSVKPCDDFYQYSCGGFLKNNYIRDDQSKLNAFSSLYDKIQYQMKALIEKENLTNYAENSAMKKTIAYYHSCMNESQIESAGRKPILDLIATYKSCPSLDETWDNETWSLETALAQTLLDTGSGIFIAADVSASIFNTSEVVFSISSGTTTVGVDFEDKFNLPATSALQKQIDGYKTYVKTVLILLEANSTTVEQDVEDIFSLEYEFVKARQQFFRQGAVRGYKTIVKYMTLGQLNNFTQGKFNWTLYTSELLRGTSHTIQPDEKLLVVLPDNIKVLVDIITKRRRSVLANTVIWDVISGFITALPSDFQEANVKYGEILRGVKTLSPRWRTCSTVINDHFSYTTALVYSNVYLSEEARQRAFDLFSEVRDEFIDGLADQTWMDNETRDAARLKLDLMKTSVGYPPFIKDSTKLNDFYKEFQIDVDNFFENKLNYLRTRVKQKINQLGKKPVLPPFPAPPVGVNAFYHPTSNGMAVLAGMLQPPYYGNDRLKALNYGGIGMVIGHEITHGFDVSGSQFDEKGNLRAWWTKESRANFYDRSMCLLKQYNETYIFGRKVNGLLTLSENIADNGGLKYAFRAYRKWRESHGDEDKLPGLNFTNDQLFFIGFAQAWCSKYRDGSIDALMTDSHALGPVRVRIPLTNIPAFSEAFACKKPTHTCTVW